MLTDDIEIFKILAAADRENFDPLKNQVLKFSFNETWNLFLFSASGRFKGCRLYILENISLEIALHEKLLPELLSLPDHPEYFFLKNEALQIVETLIGNRKNDSLFFDAH